jgi:hypothetical protein
VNPRSSAVENYSDFTPSITHRRDLAAIVQSDPALASAHAGFHKTLAKWWQKNLPHVIALAPDGGKKGNVYELRRLLLASIEQTFAESNSSAPTGHPMPAQGNALGPKSNIIQALKGRSNPLPSS